jgi:hypothetical protein
MLSQRITKSTITGKDTTLDCPGIRHVLKNNVSFKYSSLRDTLNLGSSTSQFNSFTPQSGVVVAGDDFLSITESLLIAPRETDGSLPRNDFLRLKQGSDLIDAGTVLGFPFKGAAPDLGAFETDYPTLVADVSDEKTYLFPNPVKSILFFKTILPEVYLYDLQGNLLCNRENIDSLDVNFLQQGVYLLMFRLDDAGFFMEKIIRN